MRASDPQTPMSVSADAVRAEVDALYRSDSRRVFATLIRLLGDFDVAEEALHDAFRAALEQWPCDGVHANAASAAAMDRAQIVDLYDALQRTAPSPVIELNRAAALAMRDGPAAALVLVDDILARGDLTDYHLAHSARAELCRRLGRTEQAREAFRRALDLTQQEPERRFIERRLRELVN